MKSLEPLTRNNVLVVVPMFNEQDSIGQVLDNLLKENYQLVVVDDGSKDNSRDIALSKGVNVLSLPFNLGVGAALRAGFKFAGRHDYQAVIQVDADGQHSCLQISELINAANETNAHLVIGSRFQHPEESMSVPIIRRSVMRVLAALASRATEVKITDATSGFRLIRQPLLSEFAQEFPSYYLGDTYEALVSAGRAGYTVREIPAVIVERIHGESSASRLQSVKFIFKCVVVAGLGLQFRIKSLDTKSLLSSSASGVISEQKTVPNDCSVQK